LYTKYSKLSKRNSCEKSRIWCNRYKSARRHPFLELNLPILGCGVKAYAVGGYL
jgi:hypothetical protein